MKKIHYALLLSLLIIPGALHAQFIKWNADTKLEWSDFKGKIDESNPYFANTMSYTKYAYQPIVNNGVFTLTFTIENSFDQKQSWSRKDKQTPALLAHEQLHFDISELFARKLMVAFNSFKYSANYQSEVSKIFAQNVKEKRAMQEKYDTETNHSINKEKQQEWETYVKEQLKQIPSY
jgi:hypothetical protein